MTGNQTRCAHVARAIWGARRGPSVIKPWNVPNPAMALLHTFLAPD